LLFFLNILLFKKTFYLKDQVKVSIILLSFGKKEIEKEGFSNAAEKALLGFKVPSANFLGQIL
jgi:hypothetical protein